MTKTGLPSRFRSSRRRSRATVSAPDEIATVTPELEKFCKDLLALEGGAMTGGPYAQYGPKLRVIYPSWTGGGNWGGTSFDAQLGYLFVNTKSEGMINKLVKRSDGAMWNRVGPDHAPDGLGGLFRLPKKNYECAQPDSRLGQALNGSSGHSFWTVGSERAAPGPNLVDTFRTHWL